MPQKKPNPFQNVIDIFKKPPKEEPPSTPSPQQTAQQKENQKQIELAQNIQNQAARENIARQEAGQSGTYGGSGGTAIIEEFNVSPSGVETPVSKTFFSPTGEVLKTESFILGTKTPQQVQAIQRQAVQSQAEKQYAVNLVSQGYGGVYTSTGQFLPTTNPNFIPQGYESAEYEIKTTETPGGKPESRVFFKQDVEIPKPQQEIYVPPKPDKFATIKYIGNVVSGAGFRDAAIDIAREIGESAGRVAITTQKNIGAIYGLSPEDINKLQTNILKIQFGKERGETFANAYEQTLKKQNLNVDADIHDYISTATLALPLAGKTVEKVAGLAFADYAVYSIAKEPKILTETPPEKLAIYASLIGLGLKPTAESIYYKLKSKPPEIKAPSKKFLTDVERFSRERSTLLLEVKNEFGVSQGFVLGKSKNTGIYESPGGKIEKGETPSQAALREGGEELIGLPADLKIEPIGKFITPEESPTVFFGTITKTQFQKLSPGSDITKLKLFKPEEFTGITSPTARNIRFVPVKGDAVRITEAILLNQVRKTGRVGNVGSEFAYIQTPKGKLYLGLQSRYDISVAEIVKLFEDITRRKVTQKKKVTIKGKTLTLSGFEAPSFIELELSKMIERTSKNPQLIVSGAPKSFVTEGKYLTVEPLAKRGGAEVLYFHPPVSPGKGKAGYVGLSYVLGGGEQTLFSLFPKTSKSTILYGRSVIDRELFNLGLTLKKELRIAGVPDKQAINIVQRELNIRAKPGTIGPTAKTIYGKELEFGATLGTVFELKGERQITFLENRPVFSQNIRRIVNAGKRERVSGLYAEFSKAGNQRTASNIAKEIEFETGFNPSEYGRNIRYIPISELIAPVIRYKDIPFEKTISEKYVNKLIEKEPTKIFKQSEPTKLIENYGGGYKDIPIGGYGEIPIDIPGRYGGTFGGGGGTSGYRELSFPLRRPPIIYRKLDDESKKRMRKARARAYAVLFKRKGRFVSVRTGLPRGRALQFGAENVQKELSRQFKIIQSGTTDIEDIPYRPRESAFRPYRVKKGRAISLDPDRFIQKISATLQSREEKALIASARKSKKSNPFGF